jgi:hypothetical protein
MREEPVAAAGAGLNREGAHRTGTDMARRYPIALMLYAVLAALSWFTLEGRVLIMGKPVELRLVPLLILGGLALRTVLAMQAEKIRRSDEEKGRG